MISLSLVQLIDALIYNITIIEATILAISWTILIQNISSFYYLVTF